MAPRPLADVKLPARFLDDALVKPVEPGRAADAAAGRSDPEGAAYPRPLLVDDIRYLRAAVFAPGCLARDKNVEMLKGDSLATGVRIGSLLLQASAVELAPMLAPALELSRSFPARSSMPERQEESWGVDWRTGNCGADATRRM